MTNKPYQSSIRLCEICSKELKKYSIAYTCSRACNIKRIQKQYQEGKINPMKGKKRPDLSEWNRKNNPIRNKGKFTKENYPERARKISEARRRAVQEGRINCRGENNSNWRGGISSNEYSFEFNKELKLAIKIRDGFKCKICKIEEKDTKQGLHIHHIDYNKRNCSLDNLVALCGTCHTKTNTSRSVWRKYFSREFTVQREYVSWEQVQHECKILAQKLQGTLVTGVVGIPRGGVPIATILSYILNVPVKIRVEVQTDIIIDDIVDFGVTFRKWKRRYPKNLFLSLYTNSTNSGGKVVPDFSVRDVNKYIVFPWEVDPLEDNFDNIVMTPKALWPKLGENLLN